MSHLQEMVIMQFCFNPKSPTPFYLLNLNIVSIILSSITILPPNYLHFQNSLPHPKKQSPFHSTFVGQPSSQLLGSLAFARRQTITFLLLHLTKEPFHVLFPFLFLSPLSNDKLKYLFLIFHHSPLVTMLMKFPT